MRNFIALPLIALLATPVIAQDHSGHTMPMPAPAPAPAPAPTPASPPAPAAMEGMDHSGHDMSGMDDEEVTEPDWRTADPRSTPMPSEGSGTSRLPGSEGAMHGQHIMASDWMVMAHGYVSTQYTDHTGPRGDDKFYATSMGMLTGERDTSWGRIQLKSMFSLEPAMDSSGYPNLFATGETSGGQPLVDLVKSGPLKLRLNVPSRVLASVKVGRLFDVSIDETGKTYQARVAAINSRVDPVSQTIELEADMTKMYSDLLPGMSGTANLAVPNHAR